MSVRALLPTPWRAQAERCRLSVSGLREPPLEAAPGCSLPGCGLSHLRPDGRRQPPSSPRCERTEAKKIFTCSGSLVYLLTSGAPSRAPVPVGVDHICPRRVCTAVRAGACFLSEVIL